MENEEIQDRLEIGDVLVRYCSIIDSGDVERIKRVGEEVFTDDAVNEHVPGPVQAPPHRSTGRTGISEFFVASRAHLEATVHTISNVVIDLQGDDAKVSSIYAAWHWLNMRAGEGPSRPADVVALGRCDDQFRRTHDGWRIAHRAITVLGFGIGQFGTGPMTEPIHPA
jgi:hypothetical protein